MFARFCKGLRIFSRDQSCIFYCIQYVILSSDSHSDREFENVRSTNNNNNIKLWYSRCTTTLCTVHVCIIIIIIIFIIIVMFGEIKILYTGTIIIVINVILFTCPDVARCIEQFRYSYFRPIRVEQQSNATVYNKIIIIVDNILLTCRNHEYSRITRVYDNNNNNIRLGI